MTDHLKSLPATIKAEAKEMAEHYVAFYCLENYIRQVIEAMLLEIYGLNGGQNEYPIAVQSATKTQTYEIKWG